MDAKIPANSNVVELPKKEKIDLSRLQLSCGDCDCLSFFIDGAHTVTCCNCHKEIVDDPDSAVWRFDLPDTPKEETEFTTSGCTSVRSLGSHELAMRSVYRDVTENLKQGTLRALISYNIDGSGKHWLDIQKPGDTEWFCKKIEHMLEGVRKTYTEEEKGNVGE